MDGVNTHQIGGNHYAKGGSTQHWDLIELNGYGYVEGCATKYLCRWREKGGVQDLEKSIHYCEKLISLATFHGRRNRFQPLPISVPPGIAEFCANNKVGMMEEQALRQILTWDTVGDLHNAIGMIRHIIATANIS